MSATAHLTNYFTQSLKDRDPELYASMADEYDRQQHEIELIASENIVSKAVLEAQGSVLTNKYAEGYLCSPIQALRPIKASSSHSSSPVIRSWAWTSPLADTLRMARRPICRVNGLTP